jgi:predicted nuclease of predicted toxin-antitoxin system
MKFLVDQDVYAATSRHLSDLGHDVVLAAQGGLSQASDEDLLRAAREQGRILVTRDRDFGSLVFVNVLGAGVMYLRMRPATQAAVHLEMEKALAAYTEQELRNAFVVVEPGGHRIRRLPQM